MTAGRTLAAPLLAALVFLGTPGIHARAATPAAPAIGATATYRWTSARTHPVAVLVRELGAGGQVSWSVAQEMAAPPPLFVTYGIVRGDQRTYTLQIVTHERADGPPLSVTQVTVDRRTGKAVRSVIQRPRGIIATPESGVRPLREADVRAGRPDDVMVPAGQFAAVRGTLGDAEVWVSDRVTAFGLVKAVSPSGALELVRSAETGAEDLLGRRAP